MDIADVVGLELTSPSVAEKGMAERKDGEMEAEQKKKSFEAPYIPDNRNHLLFYLFSFFSFPSPGSWRSDAFLKGSGECSLTREQNPLLSI